MSRLLVKAVHEEGHLRVALPCSEPLVVTIGGASLHVHPSSIWIEVQDGVGGTVVARLLRVASALGIHVLWDDEELPDVKDDSVARPCRQDEEVAPW